MAEGQTTNLTAALVSREWNQGSHTLNFSQTVLDLLVADDNVLAVEVHNSTINSTDLVFIPKLSGQFHPPPVQPATHAVGQAGPSGP